MKILVCISQTPDTTTKIKFNGEQTQFDSNGVQFIMNPYDEWYALVRAIELKEQQGGEVTVLHVGPASNEPTIRKALAIVQMVQYVLMLMLKMHFSLPSRWRLMQKLKVSILFFLAKKPSIIMVLRCLQWYLNYSIFLLFLMDLS